MPVYNYYYELPVYKVCREFRKKVSAVVKSHFPKEENYLLKSQLLDASRSVTANIAEGFGRYHYQENIQFCRQARGSLDESHEHLVTAYDDKYITKEVLSEFNKQ
ncbi:MAG: four helix bundle protein [Bacteroidetes bacterium]|nr:four helix bundle protein [Bacteroidota bacterium]